MLKEKVESQVKQCLALAFPEGTKVKITKGRKKKDGLHAQIYFDELPKGLDLQEVYDSAWESLEISLSENSWMEVGKISIHIKNQLVRE